MDESKIEKPKIKEEEMEIKNLIDTLKKEGPVAAFQELRKTEEEWRDISIHGSEEALEGLTGYALKKHSLDLLRECTGHFQDLIKDARNEEEFRIITHSACHLFENRSILSSSDYLKDAEKIVETSVSKAIDLDHIGCVDRMVGPIVGYNLDKVAEENDKEKFDKRYPFKPAVLTRDFKELMNLLDPEYEEYQQDIRIFLSTETPKDLVVEYIKRGVELIKRIDFRFRSEDTLKLVNLLDLAKDYVQEDELKSYLFDVYGVKIDKWEDIKRVPDNVKLSTKAREKKEGLLEGIFVDVEGTLIINGKLNKELVESLEAESKKGKKIVVFSDGSPEKLSETLAKMGFPENFLPVISKSKYKGKYLEKIVDDADPQYQGFGCRSYEKAGSKKEK